MSRRTLNTPSAPPALLAAPPRSVARPATGLLWYRGVRCPGCFGQHFNVGRVTAECAQCGTPLIIASAEVSADLSQEN